MGTPDFSTPCLEALVKAGHDVVGAVSQPDKPQGRGRKLVPTQVKQAAMRLGLPVFQPEKLRDGEFERILLGVDPELIVVVAYGRILPKFVLDYPKYGCINVHASLLPKYRGAGPIQRAIIDGEKVTGVTTMYMSEGLDEGDILLSRATEIAPDETAGELFDRLSEMGAELLIETIEDRERQGREDEAGRRPQQLRADAEERGRRYRLEQNRRRDRQSGKRDKSMAYGLHPVRGRDDESYIRACRRRLDRRRAGEDIGDSK